MTTKTIKISAIAITLLILLGLLNSDKSPPIIDENGIMYSNIDVFNEVNTSDSIRHISSIRNNICQLKLVLPLSPLCGNELNEILINKNKEIRKLYPNYQPSDGFDHELAEAMIDGSVLSAVIGSAAGLVSGQVKSHANEKIFADQRVKDILLVAEQQTKKLLDLYARLYTDNCRIKILDFETRGWYKNLEFLEFLGAHKGKHRDTKITLNVSDKLIVNLETTEYDNGKFKYKIKSAKAYTD
jgi:hypothetical protein